MSPYHFQMSTGTWRAEGRGLLLLAENHWANESKRKQNPIAPRALREKLRLGSTRLIFKPPYFPLDFLLSSVLCLPASPYRLWGETKWYYMSINHFAWNSAQVRGGVPVYLCFSDQMLVFINSFIRAQCM